MAGWCSGLALAMCALTACGGEPSFVAPTGPLPGALSELGVGFGEEPPAPLARYAPRWPLWSSGSDKDRLYYLPAPIDTSAPDRWQLPRGTMLFKTFSYELGPDTHRPVETRVLRLLDTGWEYSVYLWAADGSDAHLIDLGASVVVELVDDRGVAFEHRVPSRLDCRTCHESARAPVLGFSELQLDDATLAELDAAGLRSVPSPSPERIDHPDSATRDVLGLFQGNCVHCHHGGAGASASFDLRHDVALANVIDVPTMSSASAAGIRVVPGDPGSSILFLALSGETDDPAIKPMPPLGVDRRDTEGIELVRDWIESLASEP